MKLRIANTYCPKHSIFYGTTNSWYNGTQLFVAVKFTNLSMSRQVVTYMDLIQGRPTYLLLLACNL